MLTVIVIQWLIGVCLSVTVHQTPGEALKNPGDEVQLVCSHAKTDYTLMLWYMKSPGDQALKLIGYLNYNNDQYEESFEKHFKIKGDLSGEKAKNASMIITELKAPEHSAVYYCAASRQYSGTAEAYFGGGTKLTVLEKDRRPTSPTVKVIRPSPRECTNQKDKGKKKTIVCVASGFYPDHVSVLWKIDGENVTNNVATDEDAKMVGDYYRITSRLRVSREDYYSNPKKEFTCEVSFFNKTHTTYHSDGISSDEDKQTVTMTREKYLSITQSAKLSYGVLIVKSCVYGAFVCFLVWKLQGSGKPIK